MVKWYFIISLVTLLFTACDDVDAPDCLKTSGDERSFRLTVGSFSALEINDAFEVIIRKGQEQSVELVIGENLADDISASVEEGTLVITDGNSCRWVRELNFPRLIITTPDLIRIRQNGGGIIRSEGVLDFDNLHLISEGQTGDFELNVDCNELQVTNNDLSNYHISGKTDHLNVFFASGDGRFEGAGLEADIVNAFQRGTNDIVVFAKKELTGSIISTGDLIYTKAEPEVIDVSLEGKGKLIFRE